MTSTHAAPPFQPLPAAHLERLDGWAMLARSMGYVYRPSTIEGVREVLRLAAGTGRTVAPHGAGFSYGDASLNSENLVLDLSRMNRVLDWDPAGGIIRVEPGLTVGGLWHYTLEDGWWPPVVPGTMFPTLGGAASTNVHGKNHWRAGSLGEHILAADLMLPSGEIITISPESNPEIFAATVGGLGMLGVLVSLTLKLERVSSGLLHIEEYAAPSLDGMFTLFRDNLARADHLIGWIDGYGSGAGLGRGLVQVAGAVTDDPNPALTLRPSYQDLPDTLFGVVPRSALWRGMRLGANNLGLRALNTARFTMGSFRSGRTARVPHAQYHFILDYVPNWKWAFRPGIVQFQPFVPESAARDVFATLLEESQREGLVPSLAVFKRHRPDPFLLSYGVDGYSLALDYHVSPATQGRIEALLSRFTHELVLPAGGRFYPAKDNAADGAALRRSLTPVAMEGFLALKRRLDPQGMLSSNLYRRVFESG